MDAPLDPEEQADYRANRELRTNHPAFISMQEDAKAGRSFSNIVAEYTKVSGKKSHPLKIVGGQHRFKAIQDAISSGWDEYHGVKVYFGPNLKQRLDVQLISNTNITISPDLVDRMLETEQGAGLRNWCHKVGLLASGQDFTDQFFRGGPISVRMARPFITNYYKGIDVKLTQFMTSETTPVLGKTGERDADWENLKASNPNIWSDSKLEEAAKEFSLLVVAQRRFFAQQKGVKPVKPDYPEKAWNAAVYTAWSYVAGLLAENDTRLKRHFGLKDFKGKDPLNADVLAKGKHRSDPDNYRGLGYRTDPQERGAWWSCFTFRRQTGRGITKKAVDAAIAAWHAKDGRTCLRLTTLLDLFWKSPRGFWRNAISEEFGARPDFSAHEKGVVLEKEVRLENGEFVLSNALKMTRLEDRIQFFARQVFRPH